MVSCLDIGARPSALILPDVALERMVTMLTQYADKARLMRVCKRFRMLVWNSE